ncbi:MAG: hypothetical protein M3Z35_02490 [Nitrospirota bacterium]|nr:hypothetical protein [Nitrospirota bacterium]
MKVHDVESEFLRKQAWALAGPKRTDCPGHSATRPRYHRVFQAVRKDPAREYGKDQAAQLAERLPEFKHIVFVAAAQHGDGRQDGSALLSRLPFEQVEHHVRHLGIEPPHEAEDPATRIILCIRLTSPTLSIRSGQRSDAAIDCRWIDRCLGIPSSTGRRLYLRIPCPDKRIDYVWARQEPLSSLKVIDVVKEAPNADGARLSDPLALSSR